LDSVSSSLIKLSRDARALQIELGVLAEETITPWTTDR
jgi:hypothetical protein